jgi:hypothetical protein
VKELMAFLVLSLPILAGLLIVVLAFFVARAVARRKAGSERRKTIAGLVAALIVILIPFWDEGAGRLYFHYLCSTEGGVKVNKQIELPAEYWNSDGSQKFFPPAKHGTDMLFKHHLEYRSDVMRKRLFNVTEYTDILLDRSTGDIAGSYSWFLYFGGWLVNVTSLDVKATSCHGYKTTKYEDFLKHVLIQERNRK